MGLRLFSIIVGFNLILSGIIILAPSLWIMYYGIEIQWMLLMSTFLMRFNGNSSSSSSLVIGNSSHVTSLSSSSSIDGRLVLGIWNYWISNVCNGLLILTGIVFGLGSILAIVIMSKIGYFPLSNVVISYILGSTYDFILLDVLNKGIYVGMIINIRLFDSLSSSLFWLLLLNSLFLISLIKFIWNLKVLLFISSLISYLIIIILVLLNIYLWIFSSLIVYIGMIVFGVLLIRGISNDIGSNGNGISSIGNSNRSNFAFLSSLKSFSIFSNFMYCLLALYLLALFSFIPSFNFVIKLFSFYLLMALSSSYLIFIVVFMIFIYQVYLLRSICLVI